MADVQFPTNNFDAAHGGKQPNNTDNTDAIASANQGRERTGSALYSDNRYVDGDGLLYALGMTAQRVLNKGKDLTPEDASTKNKGGLLWSGSSTGRTLGLNLNSNAGLEINTGLKIKLKDLSLAVDSSGLGVNLNSAAGPGYNTSGLQIVSADSTFNGGLAVWANKGLTTDTTGLNVDSYSLIADVLQQDGALTNGLTSIVDTYTLHAQLGIKLKDNTTGLIADSNGLYISYNNFFQSASYTSSSASGNTTGLYFDTTAGKLKVNYGNGLQINTNDQSAGYDQLEVKAGTGITVDSGGVSINPDGMTSLVENPLYIHSASHKIGFKYAEGLDLNSAEGNSLMVKPSNNSILSTQVIHDTVNSTVTGGVSVNLATNSGLALQEESGSGNSYDSGGLYVAAGDGLILSENHVNVNIVTASTTTGLKFTYDSVSNRNKLDVAVATTNQIGVTKLYNNITDNVTDGAATPEAVFEAIKSAVEGIQAQVIDFVIPNPNELPDLSQATAGDIAEYKKHIYLIKESQSGPDVYAEYYLIDTSSTSTPNYKWEIIGHTDVDLSGYMQKTDVLTATEINAIVTDVFGF